MKKMTIGIPAFKAQKHICDCLASIQIQTIKNDISIIIASDFEEDDYSFVNNFFPDLDITILPCKKNTGPGLARQRCIDACKTDQITFIDADDVFFTPFALEILNGGIAPNVIEVQAPFLQEIAPNPQGVRSMPRNDMGHPQVFGRLYNIQFLKQNKITFDELRAMEDGEFNQKIRMTISGTSLKINILNDPVYLQRIGSEHSITRIGEDEDGIPQYNFDLCQIGATIASIRAAQFCKKKNPFNGGVDKFVTDMMVGQYFTYIECLKKKPIFEKQNFFNAKRFYNECFKEIEERISDEILTEIYTTCRKEHGDELIGIIPKISFFEFMDKIKNEPYRGEEELKEIRAELPEKIIENDIKTGVAIF